MLDVEKLAKELHEAGREAVEKGNTVAAGKFGDPSRKFLEWNEISESAREGRRTQARYHAFTICSMTCDTDVWVIVL